MHDKPSIAIIPARMGSKRIPKKNIGLFLDMPILSYAVKSAIDSELFDEVMVSTDSEEIADIAIKYGASVPFFRSRKNSDDYATLAEVLEEVLKAYQNSKQYFNTFTCILPTSVLLQIENLKRAYLLLNQNNFDSVFPVVKFSAPIFRSLKTNGLKIEMNWPEYRNTRSQDLQPAYFDAGQFYVAKIAAFFEKKTLFTDNSGFIVLNEWEAQDIDTIEDWKLAELKYRYIFHNEK
jgi:N-acylneuraminate cytidylyltransferase